MDIVYANLLYEGGAAAAVVAATGGSIGEGHPWSSTAEEKLRNFQTVGPSAGRLCLPGGKFLPASISHNISEGSVSGRAAAALNVS